MPTNALTNPLVLPILGLLTEQSAHGYGIYVALRERYTHLRVRRSTVYTLLDRLGDAGWILMQRESDRPQYSITAAGGRAFSDGVALELQASPLGPSEAFTTAVAYLGMLDPNYAATLLEDRGARTRVTLEELAKTLAAHQIPELHMMEGYYQAATLRHDAQWLESIAWRIRAGDLVWPTREKQSKNYRPW